MYLEKIELDNNGPIKSIDCRFSFNNDGSPKPLVIVGKNGSGKSIVISNLVNALISLKQAYYNTCEIEHDKVYKVRSPSYIKIGESYYYSKVIFNNGLHQGEWVIEKNRKSFEDEYKFTPNKSEWNLIPDDVHQYLWSNFKEKYADAKMLYEKNCILYFPANRYEEPGWLNERNLLSKPEIIVPDRIEGITNRAIVAYSPLKDNRDWLYNVLLDRATHELKVAYLGQQNIKISDGRSISMPINNFIGYHGTASAVYNSLSPILSTILNKETGVVLKIGDRKNRQVTVEDENGILIRNIFQMSSGESALLNIFLSIVRDYDMSLSNFESLGKITGIVIIDEVDLHLHSNHQYEILPKLIKLFPWIQFIITTHSPLFLLGLDREFAEDGFDLIELPTGQKISVEMFSEFDDAYQSFYQTRKFQNELSNYNKPILLVEGSYDIKYIQKAAELLGKEGVISKYQILDGNGYQNLNKLWSGYNPVMLGNRYPKIVLLYDCDTNISSADKGEMYKRVIPYIKDNNVQKGIENLFANDLMSKAVSYRNSFIDITQSTRKIEGGVSIVIPEKWEINKDQKRNLCDWICENGTSDDFSNFAMIFDLIDNISQ